MGVLDEEALNSLAAVTRWHVYQQHEPIVSPDDEDQRVFMIGAGLARLYVLGDGREFTLDFLRKGDILDMALAPPDFAERMEVQAARGTTLVFRAPRAVWVTTVLANSAAAKLLREQECARYWKLAQILDAFAFHSTRSRLARILGILAIATPGERLDYTHEELAQLSALPRSEVSTFMSEFRTRGCIEYGRHDHAVRVLDVEALRNL
ncbi:MAG: Crp/Fnr family transcriptional regulator [Chloroflexota bacterium]